MSYAEKTMMGQKLINIPRPKEFSPSKSKHLNINWGDEEKRFLLPFIGKKLWLLLKFNRPQEWLNIPLENWNKFEGLNVAKNFAFIFFCVNDVAERGIKL